MNRFLLMLPLLLICFFTSCEEEPPIYGKATVIEGDVIGTQYSITYVSDYGDAPVSVSISYGTKLTEAYLPELFSDWYVFSGWYYDGMRIEAGYIVTSDMTLTAKWE